MLTRSTRSMVMFSNDFTIGDSQRKIPAGTGEIVVEEQLIEGLSLRAYRRIATHLMVQGRGQECGANDDANDHTGRSEKCHRM